MPHQAIVSLSRHTGFYADFLQVLQCIALSEAFGKSWSVCWGDSSLYFNGNEVYSQLFNTNSVRWGNIEYSNVLLDEHELLKSPKAELLPPYSSLDQYMACIAERSTCEYLLFKDYSPRIFADIGFNYDQICALANVIHDPLESFRSEALDFITSLNVDHYTCLHIRGSEKVKNKENSGAIAKEYLEVVRSLAAPLTPIVLLTEDPTIYESFVLEASAYGLKCHAPFLSREQVAGKNLLGKPGIDQAPIFLNINRSPTDRFRSASTVVRDVLIAVESHAFIGSESNVSTIVKRLRDAQGRASQIYIPNCLEVLG